MATAEKELRHPPGPNRAQASFPETSSPEEVLPEPEIRKTEGSRYLPAALASIGCFSPSSYFPEVQHGNS